MVVRDREELLNSVIAIVNDYESLWMSYKIDIHHFVAVHVKQLEHSSTDTLNQEIRESKLSVPFHVELKIQITNKDLEYATKRGRCFRISTATDFINRQQLLVFTFLITPTQPYRGRMKIKNRKEKN